MVKIQLFCAAGFSTGMLVNNMRQAAKERGIEADIQAHSQGELAQKVCDTDVALLGPQVSYTLDKSKEICASKNVPIAVIPMLDYGTMNGGKVLDLALHLIQQKTAEGVRL